jgi:hypothetical protein
MLLFSIYCVGFVLFAELFLQLFPIGVLTGSGNKKDTILKSV